MECSWSNVVIDQYGLACGRQLNRFEVFECLAQMYVIVREFVNSKLYLTVRGIESIKYMFNVGGFCKNYSVLYIAFKKNILPELISGLTITVFKIMSIVLFRGTLVKRDLTSKETNLYPSSKSLHRNSLQRKLFAVTHFLDILFPSVKDRVPYKQLTNVVYKINCSDCF